MNHQRLLRMFSLTLVALFLVACGASTPTPIPVTVEGVQLQVTSATKQKTYEHKVLQTVIETVRAEPGFVFLVVELDSGDIPHGFKFDTFDERQVAIIDENGEEYGPTFISLGGESSCKLVLVITVPTNSQSFTLRLPSEQTVNLDSFLNVGWW